MQTRKDFIKTIGLTAAATPFIGIHGMISGCKPATERDQGREDAVSEALPRAFDLHCHPGRFYFKGMADYAGDQAFLNTVGQLAEARLRGSFISMVTDMLLLERTPDGIRPRGNFEPGQAWSDYKRQLEIVVDLIGRSKTKLTRSLDQVLELNEDGKSGFLLACEGGDFLEGSAERVEEAFEDGVRAIQLVHYAPNDLGDLQTADPQHGGLSEAGKTIVKKMNDKGMLIDVAHASFDTVKTIAKISAKPVMLSHSILKMEAGRPIERRAINEEHAKVVAETGGVIGAWPSGFNKSFEEYVDNTLRLIDTVGIDHVSIGTDMDSNFRPVLTSYLQVPDWQEALLAKGLGREDLAKVSYLNIFRVIRQAIG